MSIWWSLDAKNIGFQAYVTHLEIELFTYPPSLNALLRSPCQAVTMTISENVVSYDLRTHCNHQID